MSSSARAASSTVTLSSPPNVSISSRSAGSLPVTTVSPVSPVTSTANPGASDYLMAPLVRLEAALSSPKQPVEVSRGVAFFRLSS